MLFDGQVKWNTPEYKTLVAKAPTYSPLGPEQKKSGVFEITRVNSVRAHAVSAI